MLINNVLSLTLGDSYRLVQNENTRTSLKIKETSLPHERYPSLHGRSSPLTACPRLPSLPLPAHTAAIDAKILHQRLQNGVLENREREAAWGEEVLRKAVVAVKLIQKSI